MTGPAALTGPAIAWRPGTAVAVWATAPTWTEVVADSLVPADGDAASAAAAVTVPPPLAGLIERGAAVVPHGLRFSLASADPDDVGDPSVLARAAEALGSPLASEHIAFTRAGGVDVGHLVAPPQTMEQVGVIARNCRAVVDRIPVQVALKHVSAMVDWPESTMAEGDFAAEVCAATGAGLVLDVANVYANAVNRGLDPMAELARIPVEPIAYVHVAGGHMRAGRYVDSHVDPVPPQVLELLSALADRCRAAGRPAPPTMIERDGAYPTSEEMLAELGAVAAALDDAQRPDRGAGGCVRRTTLGWRRGRRRWRGRWRGQARTPRTKRSPGMRARRWTRRRWRGRGRSCGSNGPARSRTVRRCWRSSCRRGGA